MRGGILIVVAAALSACASASPLVTLEPPSPEVSTSAELPSAGTIPPDTIASTDIPLLATFLASVGDAMEGTTEEGVAFEDPAGVIGTAVLFCDLLDRGLSVEDVMTAYVAALADGDPARAVGEDELKLGGVILGAGVETICPEFRDRLDV